MDDNTQHPPMNGDDELAKTLNGGLQFEETPAPGDGDQMAPTMMPAPTGQFGDPLAGMPTPPLPGASPAEEQPEVSEPEPGLPNVHHTHGKHMDHQDGDEEKPAEEPKPSPEEPEPAVAEPEEPKHDDNLGKPASTGDSGLDKIKASALEELKPLVGKLSLAPEEKFDTLLLIIRSTDDQTLLDEAHAAAKGISDETKRAQALLDIIKEVDYFSSKR
jgi:hypothetical protein